MRETEIHRPNMRWGERHARPRFAWLWILGGCAAAILAAWWYTRPSDTVGYHLDRYRSTRTLAFASHSPMHWFSYNYLRWRLRGRPTIKELDAEEQREEDALVRLGYFQHRDFRLHNRRLDAQGHSQLNTMLNAAPFTNRLWSMESGSDPYQVRVLATPGDMRVFETTLSAFDESEAK